LEWEIGDFCYGVEIGDFCYGVEIGDFCYGVEIGDSATGWKSEISATGWKSEISATETQIPKRLMKGMLIINKIRLFGVDSYGIKNRKNIKLIDITAIINMLTKQYKNNVSKNMIFMFLSKKIRVGRLKRAKE